MTETLPELQREYAIVSTIIYLALLTTTYPLVYEIPFIIVITFISYHAFIHLSKLVITKESERKRKKYLTQT